MKWRWAEHNARVKDDRWTKIILEWRSRADKRNQEKPSMRWTNNLERISINWVATAQDKRNWKCLEESNNGLKWTIMMINLLKNMEISDLNRA